MDDLISRQDAIDAVENCEPGEELFEIKSLPSIDAVPVVRCKDCKHRPKRLEEGEGEGFNLEFPDDTFKCPCRCDDGWYNWMPDDNWFCGDGERKES